MRFLLAIALPLALLAEGAPIQKEAHRRTAAITAKKKLRKVRAAKPLASAPAPAAAEKTAPAEPKPADVTEAQPQQAPAGSGGRKWEVNPEPTGTESVFGGHIDIGARWITRSGDFNTYRSLVNLSQGTRLTNAELRLEPTDSKLLDSGLLTMTAWGGDPYNTARLDMVKRGLYRLNSTYSNIAMFNALPSFANIGRPGSPLFFNQRTMDTRIRNYDNELTLFPGRRVMPYIGFSRNTSYGTGITPLVLELNEYPLRNVIAWSLYEVRGGIRVELNRFHATLEQGGRRFSDDQFVYSTETLRGNRSTPYLGQILSLAQGSQLYRIRGEAEHTRALVTASPFSWLDLSGSFIRSRPKTYSELNQLQRGNVVDPNNPLLLLTGTTDYFFGNATMPHVSGSAAAEARLGSRIRIRESWETDRFHTTGLNTLRSIQFFTPTTSATLTLTGSERLEVSRHRQQIEAIWDVGRQLTIRGGHRYEWGRSLMKASSYSAGAPYDRLEMERQGGVFGFVLRPVQRVTLTGDLEFIDGIKTYYRTGLYDHTRLRFQTRFQLPKSLFFNANYNRLTNENPNPDVRFWYEADAISGSLQWLPGGGRNFAVIAEYQRSKVWSDIDFLYPLGLFPVASNYRDYAHTGTMLIDMRLPLARNYSGRLTAGGSFVTTSGVRPTDYYQPQGRLVLPVTQKMEFFSEYRYFGLSQTIYVFEGFRTHMYMGGVRLLM
ncbi:MAG: hypothetical protein N2036_01555 [Bryobacteraceae bacterium]|nr:hypothetical protein [Bryobacteraceae bacterium]MCX7602737.1 hypothetical protein [Bryobacteraceae bacterium]